MQSFSYADFSRSLFAFVNWSNCVSRLRISYRRNLGRCLRVARISCLLEGSSEEYPKSSSFKDSNKVYFSFLCLAFCLIFRLGNVIYFHLHDVLISGWLLLYYS